MTDWLKELDELEKKATSDILLIPRAQLRELIEAARELRAWRRRNQGDLLRDVAMENGKLKDLLKRVEWKGGDVQNDGLCPLCRTHMRHEPDCALGAVLK